MFRHKGAYAAVLILTAALLLLFPKPFIAVLLGLEIILPLSMYCLLRADISAVELSIKAPNTCVVGSPVKVEFIHSSSRPLIVASAVKVRFDMKNLLFNAPRTASAVISLSKGREQYAQFEPKMCGELVMKSGTIYCTDIFGLCAVKLPVDLQCRINIVPELTDIRIDTDQMAKARPEMGSHPVSRKGSDTSEVFDLRDYDYGDDMKSVHWKLSGKADNLIVKEFSDSTKFDTVLLYDIALMTGETEISKDLLQTAVGAALSLSKALIKAGFSHNVAFVFGGKAVTMPVFDERSANDMMYAFIAHPLSEKNGLVCQYMLAGQLDCDYETVIYLTAHSFPAELGLIPDSVNLNAVVIKEGDSMPVVTRTSPTRMVIEAGADYFKENHSFGIFV